MGKEAPSITIAVTPVEKEFIDFCRSLNHGTLKVTVKYGDPIHAYEIEKAHKFDLLASKKKQLTEES